jgi:TDG/mug DNA glycosylase family protein
MSGLLYGFAPIVGANARILLLGSMPGSRSLQAAEYYAHRQNAFWWIMAQVFGMPDEASYAQRCRRLISHGIALWDVMQACARQGSLDANIAEESIVANDFARFFGDLPSIRWVYFNGAKAEMTYRRNVLPSLLPRFNYLRYRRLPSTSPAYAAMSKADKLQIWRDAIMMGLAAGDMA